MAKGNILMVFDDNELDTATDILEEENCDKIIIDSIIFFQVTDLDHYYDVYDKCKDQLTKYILLYDNNPDGSRISHVGMDTHYDTVKDLLNIPIG